MDDDNMIRKVTDKILSKLGYSSDMIMENCQDYGFALALSKPFSMKMLNHALVELQ